MNKYKQTQTKMQSYQCHWKLIMSNYPETKDLTIDE